MPLKQVVIEVTDATSGNALRAHWQDGITKVTLRPDDPPVTFVTLRRRKRTLSASDYPGQRPGRPKAISYRLMPT